MVIYRSRRAVLNFHYWLYKEETAAHIRIPRDTELTNKYVERIKILLDGNARTQLLELHDLNVSLFLTGLLLPLDLQYRFRNKNWSP